MSTTLSHPPIALADGPPALDGDHLRRAVPVVTPLLVLAEGVAISLGADLGRAEVLAALASVVLGVALLVSTRAAGRWLSLGWLGVNALTIGLIGMHPEAHDLAAAAGVGLLTFVVGTVGRTCYSIVALVLLTAQALAWADPATDIPGTGLLLTATVVLGLAKLVGGVEMKAKGSAAVIEALADERSTVVRLYDVASSIGASTTRAEALPDLLGAVAGALRARSCAVAVLDETGTTLTLVGPVWVNGSYIPVDDEVKAVLDRSGFTKRVLRSTRAHRFDRATSQDLAPVLADLGLAEGLVTPLRLEGRETGLLIVGDPLDGTFGEAGIAELTALAAPVSLVLAQVDRHEAANEMAARLKEIAEMKSDFVSMVSHELKTPLTSVMGALDTLARPELSMDNPAVTEMVQAARRQAARLRRLIDDLLVVSRIDRGMVRPEPRHLAVLDSVCEAIDVVPGLDVNVTVPPMLEVLADGDHLGQVIINLLENARKYAPGSRVEVEAMLLGPAEVAITVIDHGPGIPSSQRARVFERFVRLDGSSQAGGTGLGLSIVKMLTEGMGGRVDVVDTPGGGATFVVVLPAVTVGF